MCLCLLIQKGQIVDLIASIMYVRKLLPPINQHKSHMYMYMIGILES